MNPWTVFGVLIAAISLMFAVLVHFNSSIEKKIENKLNDEKFIRKVANEVRLPFVIFDEEKSIIADTGAMDHIDAIEVRKGERQEVSEIIISPKRFMAVAPILESFDPKIEFEDPVHGEKFDYIFKRVEMGLVWADRYSGKPPKSKFRLQLVMLPDK